MNENQFEKSMQTIKNYIDANKSSGDSTTSVSWDDVTGKPIIPDSTSDLTNDSGFITIDDVPEGFDGDYNSLTNKPTIPSNVSELTNDSDFATETYVTNAIANAQLGGGKGDDGVGIQSVVQTTTSTEDGGSNVITVTKTDNTTSTFTVKNGSKGDPGEKGDPGSDANVTSANVISALGYTPARESSSTSIPTYVNTMTNSASNKILASQEEDGDNLTIITATDIHNDLSTGVDSEISDFANCIGLLTNKIGVDLVALMGDYINGAEQTESKQIFRQVGDLLQEKLKGIKTIWMKGNHDNNYKTDYGFFSDAEVYALSTKRSTLDYKSNNPKKSYGYIDYENEKIRVIFLNTSDNEDTSNKQYYNVMSPSQIEWFANVALNMTDKETPSDWKIVILSHVPLWNQSFCNIRNALRIIDDYYNAKSGTINLDGTIFTSGDPVTYDYTSVERAEIICCISGHLHGILDSTISSALSPTNSAEVTAIGSNGFTSNIPCISIPSVTVAGTNYASMGVTNVTKTANSETSTSFCAITIQKNKKKVIVNACGAGTDRTFNFPSNSDTPITPPTPTYTNQISNVVEFATPISLENGIKEGYYLSGASPYYASDTARFITGLIPFALNSDIRKPADIYVKGFNIDTSASHDRIGVFDANKVYKGDAKSSGITLTKLADKYYKIEFTMKDTITQVQNNWGEISYIAFCALKTTDEIIITFGEEITD